MPKKGLLKASGGFFQGYITCLPYKAFHGPFLDFSQLVFA
jgi:hypothetical protein